VRFCDHDVSRTWTTVELAILRRALDAIDGNFSIPPLVNVELYKNGFSDEDTMRYFNTVVVVVIGGLEIRKYSSNEPDASILKDCLRPALRIDS
jgi:hypothetical protein